jgi:hypothetical protein
MRICGQRMLTAKDLSSRFDLPFDSLFDMMDKTKAMLPESLQLIPNEDYAVPVTKSIPLQGTKIRQAVDPNETPFVTELCLSEDGAKKILTYWFVTLGNQIEDTFL